MFRTRIVLGGLRIGTWAAAGALLALPAAAAPVACKTSYSKARELVASGHLRDARDMALECAHPVCTSVVRRECEAMSAQLDSDIPTVIPLVTDASGAPVVDVAIWMDGEVLISQSNGLAVPVDPGLHEFSYGSNDGVGEKVMIVQGQRNRPIALSVRARGQGLAGRIATPSTSVAVPSAGPATPAATAGLVTGAAAEPSLSVAVADPRPGASPALPIVLGIAGLAAAGSGALFVYWGKKDSDALTKCSPNCSPSSVDHVRTLFVVGDVAAGVGVATLGVAIWRYFAGAGSRERAPTPVGYAFDVQLSRAGAVAALSGAF